MSKSSQLLSSFRRRPHRFIQEDNSKLESVEKMISVTSEFVKMIMLGSARQPRVPPRHFLCNVKPEAAGSGLYQNKGFSKVDPNVGLKSSQAHCGEPYY
jgi:hypothetical protein